MAQDTKEKEEVVDKAEEDGKEGEREEEEMDKEEKESEEEDRKLVEILKGKQGAEVHLVGTAHVSAQSCDDVANVIRTVRPQMVAVELCMARKAMLYPREQEDLSLWDILQKLQKKNENPFALLYGWFLSSVSARLEVIPGKEFQVAYEEGRKLTPPAKIVLADRPVHVTIARMWAGLSGWEKMRLCWSILRDTLQLPSSEELSELVESLKHTDMLTEAIVELGKQYPGLCAPLMQERDLFLTDSLRREADALPPHHKLVAVVGAGHVPGILEHWDKPIDIREISKMPERKPLPAPLLVLRGVAISALTCAAVLGTAWSGATLINVAVRIVWPDRKSVV